MKRLIFLATILGGCSNPQQSHVEDLKRSTWSLEKSCNDEFVKFHDDIVTVSVKGKTIPLYNIIALSDLPKGGQGVGLKLKATDELLANADRDPHLSAEPVLIGLKLMPAGIAPAPIVFNSQGEERPIERSESLNRFFFLNRCPIPGS